MGTSKYSDEFKQDAVHQITVRGYVQRPRGGMRRLPTLSSAYFAVIIIVLRRLCGIISARNA